jgi:ABC-type antimicrobial peptide transport system permease subunit
LQDVAIHPIVLLFALALSLITSLFFGFAPAYQAKKLIEIGLGFPGKD